MAWGLGGSRASGPSDSVSSPVEHTLKITDLEEPFYFADGEVEAQRG